MALACCPRCGVPDILFSETHVRRGTVQQVGLVGSEILPVPPGEGRQIALCGGCGARWPRVRDFEKEWRAAGAPAR
jgi:hypothetical protein